MKLKPRLRALGFAAALGLGALALPGTAAAATSATSACPGAAAPVFASWHDTSNYLLATNGDLEAGATGWTLSGGAGVVSGGDPFALGGRMSSKALALPAGSSATTPASCIAKGMPTFRLTARNTGSATSRLRVEVVYTAGAKRASLVAGDVTAGAAWAPTKQLSLALGQVGDATSVQFRFTPLDGAGSWQIDSVYIDPCLRR